MLGWYHGAKRNKSFKSSLVNYKIRHTNILQLKEIIRNDNDLFLVYEMASESILELLQKLKYNSQTL